VLNAADPLVAGMAEHCPGTVVFFALGEQAPGIPAHRAAGGRAVFVSDGEVVLVEGSSEEVLIDLADVPLTYGGKVLFQVENVLAAAAATWSLGLAAADVRAGLGTFRGDDRQSPGRFNVYRTRGATVIVDYAHNPSALQALIASLSAFPAVRRSIVFCPGNRRDSDVLEMGRLLGNAFDRVLLYQDRGNSDRADGELNALLRQALALGRRVRQVSEAARERDAIVQAMDDLTAEELLVVGVEEIDAALGWVRAQLEGAAVVGGV
jgi:cyanophycin synthetase